MFPSLDSITRSIVGAWKIFRWDASGLDQFDLSNKSFWQSFLVPIVLAPVYLFVLLQIKKMGQSVDLEGTGVSPEMIAMTGPILFREMVRYTLGFVLFPVAMIFFTRLLNFSDRFVPLIIVYNWTSGLLLGAIFGTSILFYFGLFSVAAASSALLVLMLIWPFYLFSGVRISTGASIGVAIGLVIMDIVIGQLIVFSQALF